jgi:hypothetical protein
LTPFQKLTLYLEPGPLISGIPSLSNEIRCNLTVTRMSVYSFQNENDGPQQNATIAARCMQGVLLPAAVGAPPRCACKFLVPHFSSFGVSTQHANHAWEMFPERMFRVLTASNVCLQVVDDAPDTQSPVTPPTPTSAPPNRPLPPPPSDAASGSSSGAASPGAVAGSVIGSIACEPWQPQPCTKFSRIWPTLPCFSPRHSLSASVVGLVFAAFLKRNR